MNRILIIDDEYYIRERLKIILSWEDHGFVVAGEAENGAEALEKVRELRPDALLVDIKMPGMDGLALAKEVHRLYPQVVMIILTGYNTFEYARQAIRCGVAGYLLKPVNREELAEQLAVVRKRLAEQEQDRRNRVRTREAAIDDCLCGLVFEAGGWAAPAREGLPAAAEERCGRVVLLRLADIRVGGGLRHSLYELLARAFPQADSFVFHPAESTVGMLICGAQEEGFGDALAELPEAWGFPAASSLCVSGQGQGRRGLATLYRQAEFALRESIFTRRRVVFYEEALAAHCCGAMQLASLRDRLLMELRSGRLPEALELIGEQFRALAADCRSYGNLSRLSHELLGALAIYGDGAAFLQEYNERSIQMLLESYFHIDDLQEWFAGRFRELYSLRSREKTPVQYQMVRQAKAVIDGNYCSPLCSLDFVAAEIGCNANYLSGLFKKATGISLVQYITNRRMEDAGRLLKENYGTLAAICEKIGYNDVFYFSKRFKRHFGVAPSGFTAL